MAEIVAQLEQLAKEPPHIEATRRQALCNALQKALIAIEDPYDTVYRVVGSPKILTFSHIAVEIGLFKLLAESPAPLSLAVIAGKLNVDFILAGRILRFLAANHLVTETDEDMFTANSATNTLARPAFGAGIAHSFLAIMPCLQATPEFLANTDYRNPSDVLHSPFQIAHRTDQAAFVWAMGQPRLMKDFNLWMSELHDGAKTWLDVFDYADHIKGASTDSLVFVDVGGGIGQQCALLKKTHSALPGQIILQEQELVLAQAIETEGVEKEVYDFWGEQPRKGARIYYLRNILHDYPDEKATKIIGNHLKALTLDSIIVIDEIVVPNRGAHPRITELDTTMMTTLASIERTRKQWLQLLDHAGLRVTCVKTYNQVTGESVLVTKAK